jgi:CelD/BcsL family acetyltransferase involved in cellulose biosynthesis
VVVNGSESDDRTPERSTDELGAAKATAFLATELTELEPFEDAWRALAVAHGSPHATPDFYRAWMANYGEHAHPYVPVLLDEAGELSGLIPLVITRDALRQVQVAGANFWAALPAVARAGEEQQVALAAGRLLAGRRREWRSLTLDHVATEMSWLDTFVRGLSGSRRGRMIEKRVQQAWLTVDLSRGWEGYVAEKRSKFKHELHRAERRLHESHVVASRQATTMAELRVALDALFRLHALRRDALGGSTFDSPAMRGTLSDFAERALRRGWLRLRSLELDGEVAAADLSFRVGDRCTGYLMAWDPRWANLGLGRLMLVDGLHSAADEGVREFDLNVGHSDMKARHATEVRSADTLWIYPRRTAALFALRRAGRRFLPDAVRRSLGRSIRSPAGRVDLPS